MDVFTAVSNDARTSIKKDYRDFLRDRDGTVDVERRTLSRREKSMERFLVEGRRAIDREGFAEQYARFDPKRPTSPEALLLLALVKVNAAEAYGVNRSIDGALARAKADGDDTTVRLLVEEFYHTKILLSAARLYGIEVGAPAKPHVGLRALVSSIATLPEFVARPLTLAGEIIGVLVFLNLLDVARSVLKDSPEVRDAIEERLMEILIDELGHVTYQRICMGRAGLTVAKTLLPVVAHGLANAVPEVRFLGATPKTPIASIAALDPSRFPEAVRRHAFIH